MDLNAWTKDVCKHARLHWQFSQDFHRWTKSMQGINLWYISTNLKKKTCLHNHMPICIKNNISWYVYKYLHCVLDHSRVLHPSSKLHENKVGNFCAIFLKVEQNALCNKERKHFPGPNVPLRFFSGFANRNSEYETKYLIVVLNVDWHHTQLGRKVMFQIKLWTQMSDNINSV